MEESQNLVLSVYSQTGCKAATNRQAETPACRSHVMEGADGSSIAFISLIKEEQKSLMKVPDEYVNLFLQMKKQNKPNNPAPQMRKSNECHSLGGSK